MAAALQLGRLKKTTQGFRNRLTRSNRGVNLFAATGALTVMGMVGTLIAGLSAAFFVMIIATQVMLRRRARAMTGATLPALTGALGHRVAASKKHALVYFFSPACGACRTITPRVRELEKTNPTVFAVDVTLESDLARALGVMATPSTIEVSDGHIAGYHVGPIPPAVLARFTAGRA